MAAEPENETFTDFMIRCMESEHDVQQVCFIVRRSDGSFGYKTLNQEVMDTLGMLPLHSDVGRARNDQDLAGRRG